jgi:hypothetical protein
MAVFETLFILGSKAKKIVSSFLSVAILKERRVAG